MISDILFSISVTFELKAVVVTSPIVLGINILLTSLIFLSRPCLSESYCVLEANELVLGTLASTVFIFNELALTFVNNQPYTVILTAALFTILFSLLK